MNPETNLTPSSNNDEFKELFLDYNMNCMLDVHEYIERYHELGLFNSSKSYDFIDIFMNNLYFGIYDENEDIESFSE